MSIHSFPPVPPLNPDNMGDKSRSDAVQGSGVVFDIKKKRLKVSRDRIKKITDRFAEVAESMGLTNNVEQFSDDLAEDIIKGFEKAAKRLNKPSLK